MNPLSITVDRGGSQLKGCRPVKRIRSGCRGTQLQQQRKSEHLVNSAVYQWQAVRIGPHSSGVLRSLESISVTTSCKASLSPASTIGSSPLPEEVRSSELLVSCKSAKSAVGRVDTGESGCSSAFSPGLYRLAVSLISPCACEAARGSRGALAVSLILYVGRVALPVYIDQPIMSGS